LIFAFDTYYNDNEAHTVCLGFENWADPEATLELAEDLKIPDEYVSGEFYKRELPCILSLLKQIRLQENDTIVVDGFVVLDDTGKWGLGGHLYEALGQKTPVVGVAKNNFATLNILKKEVYRGESQKPLYITCLGMELEQAARLVASMFGEYRMPDILKRLDQKTRLLL